MADNSVAELDRRGRELEDALSGAERDWNDSRRHAMDGRYLRPHTDAHGRLHSQLTSLLAISGRARIAAENAVQAASLAKREGEQGTLRITGARTGIRDAGAAEHAGVMAEASAAQGHGRTAALAEQANSIFL